ncbi:asparaginase [Thermosediminibacter litoriperuensis]|uniref:L-asparaginase n=1 Tax=Thermosediminibacter litoriperuensis TaxID=291989 RepID=A0A5S5AG55_9FIRM|nr:asparaginase [Thermosediminibacter litoriperuensis]TYP49242.1 L-asparaginase [Thermosediminibacter litoriperuensis]
MNGQKKKIAFLATGGTIASVPGPEGLRPAFTEKEMLELVPGLSELADIEGRLIMNIDSSNMQPEDWVTIAREVERILSEFDGVVVSHGTDTMAYTSAALTYMLTYLKKPVVLTGAQKSIGEENSDAGKNLMDSFRVAASGRPGVFVVFDGRIIFGDRAAKMKSRSFDAFHSVNAPLAGRVAGGGVEWDQEALAAEGRRISQVWDVLAQKAGVSREAAAGRPVVLCGQPDPRVLLVKLYPGIEPEVLLLAKEKGYHSVLIESFGAGGVTFRHPRNLLPAIRELIDSGITVAVTTQVPFEGVDLTLYEVGRKALEAGAISTGTDTREAALVKLMLKCL